MENGCLREKTNPNQVLYKLFPRSAREVFQKESLKEALSLLRAYLQKTPSVVFADCSKVTLSLTGKKKRGREPQNGGGGSNSCREPSTNFCFDGLLFKLDQGACLHYLGESVSASHLSNSKM